MPLLVEKQLSPEWFAAHVGRITASTAAGCLGLDPYTSRQKAWRSIMGLKTAAELKPNGFMQHGNDHEAEARFAYEAETGNTVQTTGFWVHPFQQWLGASPDGLIDNDGLLEIKCPQTLPTWVPPHHRIQIQVQLAVTGYCWCDYCAWVEGKLFIARLYPVRHVAGLLRRLETFHRVYVLGSKEPDRKKGRRKQKILDAPTLSE